METFERLLKVKDNPELFQQECEKIKEEFILSLPKKKRERYQAIQWRIDQELSHYSNPISRMNKMVELFWKGFFEFQQTVGGGFQQVLGEEPIAEKPPIPENIIPIKPKS